VLVALEDGAEAVGPLVQAVGVPGRVVGHQHGDLSSLLETVEGLVEPGEHITRVVSLGEEVEVHVVAGFSVHCNHIHSINVLHCSI